MSSSSSSSASSTDELHVRASPIIPFPAPAPTTPLRSKRSAAHAASSAISKASQNQSIAADGSDTEMVTEGEEPDLTNDDTAESWTAGEGETDEAIYNEEDEADLTLGEPTEDDEPVQAALRKRKIPVKRKAKEPVITASEEDDEGDGAKVSNGRKTAKKAKTVNSKAKAKSKKVKTPAAGVIAKQFEEGNDGLQAGNVSDTSALTPAEDLEDKPRKQRKPRKPRPPKPEPVYVIPEVEKLPNPGYQGRLGYACLNTILRKKKPPVFCSRTCRIDTIKKNGMDFLKELGRQNMMDLAQLIQWNEENNIRFMRLSSEMFPFASHGEYGYTLEYADKELKEAGDLAKKYGHRLTTHPGQFTQLGSPREIVVSNAIKDLTYHCEMLDRMGLDQDSVMIIHGGGIFNDKPGTLQRLKKNYVEMVPDNVKGRLVLENDEICYNVDDLLPICEELGIPLVLDYHHDNIYPRAEQSLEELMPRILATWEKKGIRPKFHLSEPRLGAVSIMERRAHSDRCKCLPEPLPSHVDLMIEAKDKEQAVMELHRIYDLQPTIHENLRPPVDVETLRTQGRKSSKKKRKAGDDEEEGEELDDIDPEEVLVDMEGAEVLPPVEPRSDDEKKDSKKLPAKSRKRKADAATPIPKEKRAASPRKSRAKKSKTEKEDESQSVKDGFKAEPSEAQPIEDLKLAEVQESIVNKVACEVCAEVQEEKAERVET